jgi:hypothetical protein
MLLLWWLFAEQLRYDVYDGLEESHGGNGLSTVAIRSKLCGGGEATTARSVLRAALNVSLPSRNHRAPSYTRCYDNSGSLLEAIKSIM